MSSSSSSSSSSLEFDGSGFEFVGSSPPLPPPLPSHPPPVEKFEPKVPMVSRSPYRNIGGSSPFSTTSTRPLSVARTSSSIDDTTNHVGVVFGFFDAYGGFLFLGSVSLLSLTDG